MAVRFDDGAADALLGAATTASSLGVLDGRGASTGANRLASELDANHATRDASGPVPPITVVAHSYGTTTAADTLTRTRHTIDSFVLVGSAGIDTTYVTNLADLNVTDSDGKPGVYTTTAADDLLAPIGVDLSGRAQPNPEGANINGMSIAGAQSFSSDGGNGPGLKPVKGHNPLGEGTTTTEPFNASPPQGNGYFDRGTQSLLNIAAITLGWPEHVDGILASTDDAARSHQDAQRLTHSLQHGFKG